MAAGRRCGSALLWTDTCCCEACCPFRTSWRYFAGHNSQQTCTNSFVKKLKRIFMVLHKPPFAVSFHIEHSTLQRAGSRNSLGRATAVAAPGIFSCRDCGGGAWRQWHRPAITPGPCLARCCVASAGVACSLPAYGRAPAGASLGAAFDVTLAAFHCIENK